MSAPDAGLTSLHTFRMLPGPARRDGRQAIGSEDPMVSNSIANRAIRERIVKAFQDRGYILDDESADFGVAFYASARAKLDLNAWDYGYYRWRYPWAGMRVAEYTEGSMVIDVVNLQFPRRLLWRGEGKAELSRDVGDNIAQLAKAAEAVVAKFPRATTKLIASRP